MGISDELEGQPLLDKDSGSSADGRRPGASARVLAVAGLCGALVVGVQTLRDQPTPAAAELDSSVASMLQSTSNKITFFKRTHLSLNGVSSGEWVSTYLGLTLASHQYFFNGTTASDDGNGAKADTYANAESPGKYCSTRSVMDMELDSLAWHETESAVTPTGDLPPSFWWNYVHELHAGRFPTDADATEDSTEDTPTGTDVATTTTFEWDGFMHAASHLYTADLAPFVTLYKADKVSHLKRRYTSSDGVAMYTVHVAMPDNGNLAVLHSDTVSDPSLEALFTPLESSSCAEAVALPYATALLNLNYASMVTSYSASSTAITRTSSLPVLMPVMETAPTADAASVATYFTEGLKVLNLTATTAAGGSTDDVTSMCTFVDVEATTGNDGPADSEGALMTLRYVETPGSYDASKDNAQYSVGDYAAYVDATAKEYVGFNTGYTRWLDNHVAFNVPSGVSLDTLAGDLEAIGTVYHAHTTSDMISSAGQGSIWSMGVAGLALEWHGDFDYSKFPDPVGTLDFCTSDSVCRAQDLMCGSLASTIGVSGVHGVPSKD